MTGWRSVVEAASDGREILVSQWGPASPAVELLVLPGRGDITAKYSDLAANAERRGSRTTVVNWRGQGGSQRLDVPRGSLHVDDFDEYLLDLDVAQALISPNSPRLTVAHSMGGLIGFTALVADRMRTDRLVTTSPMLRFRASLPDWATGVIASLAVAGGRSRSWAPGEKWIDPHDCTIETNMAVEDPAAFESLQRLRIDDSASLVTGSTWGWTAAAVRAMADLRRADLSGFRTPSTIFTTRSDTSVDPNEHRRLASRLSTAELIELPGGHDLLIEGGDSGITVQRRIDAEMALIS
jgi:lysophospholipase